MLSKCILINKRIWKISLDSKLRYSLHKVKTLPPDVVIKKAYSLVKGKALGTIGKMSANIFGTEITDEEFMKAVWNSESKFQNLEELHRYFRQRKEPKFFIDTSLRDEIVKIIQDNYPETIKRTINDSDQILEHVFDLLGSGPLKLRPQPLKYNSGNGYEPIDWHTDFKTRYQGLIS